MSTIAKKQGLRARDFKTDDPVLRLVAARVVELERILREEQERRTRLAARVEAADAELERGKMELASLLERLDGVTTSINLGS